MLLALVLTSDVLLGKDDFFVGGIFRPNFGELCNSTFMPPSLSNAVTFHTCIASSLSFTSTCNPENKHSILKKDEVPGAKLLKEPEKCVVEELKRWLECHGLKKSRKKAKLIKRVKDGLKLNLPVDPKIDGGKWYNLKTEDSASIENRSSETSIASLGDLPTDGWRLFISKDLPANFNYGHVYFYLVKSPAKVSNIPDSSDSDEDNLYDNCDTATAKPLKKGRNLLSKGFVENVQESINQNKYVSLLPNNKNISVVITVFQLI